MQAVQDDDAVKTAKEEDENVEEHLVDKETDNINVEWALLLAVIDRICMALYIICVLVLVIYFFSHMAKNDSSKLPWLRI